MSIVSASFEGIAGRLGINPVKNSPILKLDLGIESN